MQHYGCVRNHCCCCDDAAVLGSAAAQLELSCHASAAGAATLACATGRDIEMILKRGTLSRQHLIAGKLSGRICS